MLRGFLLLKDKEQQLFMATLRACERLQFFDDGSQHECTDAGCSMMHTPNTEIYVCEQTGRVHECGKRCTLAPLLVPDTNAWVCPLSGLVKSTFGKAIATGAFTAAHDASDIVEGKGRTRKRRREDGGWAERDESGALTGRRVFWIGEHRMAAKRVPAFMAIQAEFDIGTACDRVINALYLSDLSNRLMGRSQRLVECKEERALFIQATKYARILTIRSPVFARQPRNVEPAALCLVVLYTWLTRGGIDEPPVAQFSPRDTPWLSAHLPERKHLPDFTFGDRTVVTHDVFNAIDHLLQEVVTYWKRFAQAATREDLTRSKWMPETVRMAIEERLARERGARGPK